MGIGSGSLENEPESGEVQNVGSHSVWHLSQGRKARLLLDPLVLFLNSAS